jgi:3-methylcrotonyl-CoA carboxylase alpha subunit
VLAIHQVFYDPLIAKLIVHGPNRREALKRLRKALGEYQIVGPSTNLEFLTRLAENEAFADEDLDTGFIPVSSDLSSILTVLRRQRTDSCTFM